MIYSMYRRGSGGNEFDDAPQGAAQRVQDTITGQVLCRMDRHIRETRCQKIKWGETGNSRFQFPFRTLG
jgi:hypothetical protein